MSDEEEIEQQQAPPPVSEGEQSGAVSSEEIQSAMGAVGKAPDVASAIARIRAALADPVLEGHPGTVGIAQALRGALADLGA